jgi:hypothetical protein
MLRAFTWRNPKGNLKIWPHLPQIAISRNIGQRFPDCDGPDGPVAGGGGSIARVGHADPLARNAVAGGTTAMAAKNGLHRGAIWCPCRCSCGPPFNSSHPALMGGR